MVGIAGFTAHEKPAPSRKTRPKRVAEVDAPRALAVLIAIGCRVLWPMTAGAGALRLFCSRAPFRSPRHRAHLQGRAHRGADVDVRPANRARRTGRYRPAVPRPQRQHYISNSLIKRWADDNDQVGVVCLHHRSTATVRRGTLHLVRGLSSAVEESKWDRIENQASLVTDELTKALGPRMEDLAAAGEFLADPANLAALVDFVVLHHARSLTVPLQQFFDGRRWADSAAAEATIGTRWSEAQSYHGCGIVLSVMPADTPVPLGAIPVFNTSDWGGEEFGTTAQFLMPLSPRVIIAGDPTMQPGQVRVVAEDPGRTRLVMWQIAGARRQFATPFLICEPGALGSIADEALPATVGTHMHWLALQHRVGRPDNPVGNRQQADWRRTLQDLERLIQLHTDPTTTNSLRAKYRESLKNGARELQTSLDEHGVPICNCSQLYHREAPEVAALWKGYMPRVICDAMNGRDR